MKLLFHKTAWNTPEFNEFVDKFEQEFVRHLKIADGYILDFNKGFYYFSGYFQLGSDIVYFCWHNGEESLRYKCVRNMMDFTGEEDRYIKITKGMVESLCNIIKNPK